jgi:isopentenyldiphosphate isomerase
MKFEQAASAPGAHAEMVDLVDENGILLGEQLEKQVVHQQGLWHRDVHVWVTDGDNVLEQQRAWHKTIMPGDWDVSVGGHVAAGETFLDAAIRETEEELGLRPARGRFQWAGSLAVEMGMGSASNPWTHRTAGGHYVVVERNLDVDSLTLQASEVIGARLYPIDQLEADISHPDTAGRHAPQPLAMWQLGIAAMRQAAAQD